EPENSPACRQDPATLHFLTTLGCGPLRPTRVLARIGSSASWADTPRPPGAGGETDDRFDPTGRADHRPGTTPYPPDFRQMLRLPRWDRSPLGGPWRQRQRGGGGPTPPKSTLCDHGRWCLVDALQSRPASP